MRTWGNSYWENEHDFKIRLVVTGKPAVLKNSRNMVFLGERCPKCGRGLRVSSAPSKSAAKWLREARKQLQPQWPFNQPIPERISVTARIVTYAADRRRRDLDNSYGAPQDALQATGQWRGILTNDAQIASHDGSRLAYDKDNPRVEITLEPYLETA